MTNTRSTPARRAAASVSGDGPGVDHHDLAHAGDARRDGGHDHRRGIAGLAARDVDPDAGQRIDAAADADAALGDLVRRRAARAREKARTRRAACSSAARTSGRGARGQRVPLGRGQLQRAQLALLESGGQRAHGRVAAGAHLGDHLARRRVDLVGDGDVAVAELRQAGGVVGVGLLVNPQHGEPASIAAGAPRPKVARTGAVVEVGCYATSG